MFHQHLDNLHWQASTPKNASPEAGAELKTIVVFLIVEILLFQLNLVPGLHHRQILLTEFRNFWKGVGAAPPTCKAKDVVLPLKLLDISSIVLLIYICPYVISNIWHDLV